MQVVSPGSVDEREGSRKMKLFCTNPLPTGIRVRQTLDMIIHTGSVSIGGRAPGSIDERCEAVKREFIAMAPKQANAVIGIQVTTNVVLNDIGGGGALYLTYCGTAAVIEEE